MILVKIKITTPPLFLSFRWKLSVFTTTFFLPGEADLLLRKFCETERKHPLTLILPNKLFYLRAKTNIIIYPWCLWFFHIFLGKVLFFSQFNWIFFRFCASHSQFGLSQEKNWSFSPSISQTSHALHKNKKNPVSLWKTKLCPEKCGKTIDTKDKWWHLFLPGVRTVYSSIST